MRIIACLPIVVLVAAAPTLKAKPSACHASPSAAADRQKPLTAHPLNQEPGARQEIAVLHTDPDGCIDPIVVRENIGGRSPAVQRYRSPSSQAKAPGLN